MRAASLFTTVALLTLLAACEGGEKGPAGTAAATGATARATGAAAVAAATGSTVAASDPLEGEDIPVAEDFEAEVEKAITDDNFDDELDAIEDEIEAKE